MTKTDKALNMITIENVGMNRLIKSEHQTTAGCHSGDTIARVKQLVFLFMLVCTIAANAQITSYKFSFGTTTPTDIAGTWTLITATGSIPSTANLRIRFSKVNETTVQFRVDDIKLTGTASQVTITRGGTEQFSASATDQFGNAMTASLTWTATGGTVDSNGLFTAGSTLGAYGVTAASGTINGSASGTIINSAPTVATAASALAPSS